MRLPPALCVLALLTGCGESSEVDLGSDSISSASAGKRGIETTAVSGGGRSGTWSVPKSTDANLRTLYEGTELVHFVAADDVHLVATLYDGATGTQRVVVCELPDCENGWRTLHRVVDRAIMAGRAAYATADNALSLITALTVSQGDVIWSESGLWEREPDAGLRILLAPISGGEADIRNLVPTPTKSIAANASYVYWVRPSQTLAVSRVLRAGSQSPERLLMSPQVQAMVSRGNAEMQLFYDAAGNRLLLSGGTGIASISPDFASEPTVVYQDEVAVQGLFMGSDAVYFPVSSLTGSIRRCNVNGYCTSSTKLADAPNWPRSLVTDGIVGYWQEQVVGSVTNGPTEELAIAMAPLDGRASRAILAENIGASGTVCRLAMNHTHVFFCERIAGASSAIRMILK